MRPYTKKERAILKKIEDQAARAANKEFGRFDSQWAWSKKFHGELEALGVAAGLKQPRSFFERRTK